MYFGHTLVCRTIVIIKHDFRERFIVLNVKKSSILRMYSRAYAILHFRRKDTHSVRQNSTVSCPITCTSDLPLPPLGIAVSPETRVYISLLKLLPKICGRIWREDASFPQIARDRLAKVYWNTVTNRAAKKPAAGIPISTPYRRHRPS